jgi:hypothetical protein
MPNHPREHALGFFDEFICRDHCVQESIRSELLDAIAVTRQNHFLGFRQADVLLKERDIAHRGHTHLDLRKPIARTISILGRRDSEESPVAGYTLQHVASAVVEPDAGARHEVPHGPRHQDLLGPRRGGDSRAGMHGDAADL